MKTATIYGDVDDELGRQCEFQVQVMLRAGIAFLAEHPGYNLQGDPAELNEAMRQARREAGDANGISGGQYSAVLTHLQVIQSKSYQWWLDELSKARDPKEVFEFDGTLQSIPQVPKQ